MNTVEVTYNNNIKSFEELYYHANKQFLLYESLEGIDDWEEYNFSIDCSEDQMKFKDILQIRFVEELTEASVSLEEPDEHFWEEIGDSINFFLSAFTMLGVDFSTLPDPQEYLYSDEISDNKVMEKPSYEKFSLSVYPVIEGVGYLCNLLKNRPWAQSNYLVSLLDFDERLLLLWKSFWIFLGGMKIQPKDVFELFWRKYQVNLFRINTGY